MIKEQTNIAGKLKLLVEDNNFSIKGLADKINVSESTLRNYLNNHRVPDTFTLLKILEVLNINIYSLYETDEKTKKFTLSNEEIEVLSLIRKMSEKELHLCIKLMETVVSNYKK